MAVPILSPSDSSERPEDLADGLHRQAARSLSAAVPAHPVGDDQETAAATVFELGEAVLIGTADAAYVATRRRDDPLRIDPAHRLIHRRALAHGSLPDRNR